MSDKITFSFLWQTLNVGKFSLCDIFCNEFDFSPKTDERMWMMNDDDDELVLRPDADEADDVWSGGSIKLWLP